jgi:predicted transposase/invertase (TIGR01784 family)
MHNDRNWYLLSPFLLFTFAKIIKKMRFVDVKNDIAFRKIFGNNKKTEILISFLNAIMQLEGDKRIKAITIVNPFQMPILPNFKTSIIDVKAQDFKGNTFIVEMQVADLTGMDKRLLYYTSKEYSQQIISGEKYTELNPVIFIGIFDFNFTEGPEYLSHHAICNVETKERVIKDMDFYFIELTKFHKLLADLDNITDKWIYFIKEAENLDVMPSDLNDEGLKEAYHDANQNTWSPAELDEYIYAGMREQDGRGRLEKAVQRAEDKKVLEFVIEMYEDGLSIDRIAKIAKIAVQKVEEIIENAKGA